MSNYTALDHLADEFISVRLVHSGFGTGEGISYELGNLIKELERLYGVKDDDLPWDDLDKDIAIQELIDYFASCSISDEATNTLAIFCLDRGLFNCQMGSLINEAYDEYLMSAVVSAKRLMK